MVEEGRWENLERGILVEIFQRLSEKDRLVGFPLVCTSWREASNDPNCWKYLDLDRWCEIQRQEWPALLCTSPQNDYHRFLEFVVGIKGGIVQSIVFPGWETRERDVLYVADRCPSLKSVAFLDCNRLLSSNGKCHSLQRAIRQWPGLQAIHVSGDLLCSMWPEVEKHCNNLREVKLGGYILCEKQATCIATHIRHIKVLVLEFPFIPKQDIIPFLMCCRELERFVVKCRVKIEMDDEIRLWASHIVHFRVEYVDQNQYVEEALVGECASTAESGVSTVPGGAELLHRPPAFQNQEGLSLSQQTF
ncbi:F-box/LRR-repeat protein At3g48880 isoform X2 [Amborella trichopoda]|uniref:F-box domain-containing protein n=1 Tax=Amborella trichopoda TaxID=13333 RepID=W1NWC0_AMBTC|nr:F-box/LRR-repeat protein At3g48880 isoform X2 [Amborella trichopoda]ERM99575.1 hypothetical protein AMTR_s00088p00126900 [Amborella trichopoda]|eukprot:XP_006836722.1 F-box/LRR-repeat protein At3g48880 isoform X2 [Amborella trichopoda]